MIKIFHKYPFSIGLFIIFIFALAFNPNSFVFQYNVNYDNNTMIDMARAWTHGYLPISDLYEQRGPLMYVLYLITTLPGKPMHWLFILELFNFAGVFFLISNILRLYNRNTLINYMYVAFGLGFLNFLRILDSGGSPEELLMIPYLYVLYVLLYYFSHNKQLQYKHALWLGIGLGFIIFVKYSLIGFHVGLLLILAYQFVKNKKGIQYLKFVGFGLLGFLIIAVPIFLYYLSFGELSDFVYSYFVTNRGTSQYDFISAISLYAKTFGVMFVFLAFLVLPFFIFIFNTKHVIGRTAQRASLLMVLIGMMMIVFILRYIITYSFPVYIMLFVLSAIGFDSYYIDCFKLLKRKKSNIFKFLILMFIAPITLSIIYTNQTFKMFNVSEMRLMHYSKLQNQQSDKFLNQGNMIKRFKQTDLFNFGSIGTRLYVYGDTYPKLKYFDMTNISYASFKKPVEYQIHYISDNKSTWVQMQFINSKHNTKKYVSNTLNVYLKSNNFFGFSKYKVRNFGYVYMPDTMSHNYKLVSIENMFDYENPHGSDSLLFVNNKLYNHSNYLKKHNIPFKKA